MNTEDVLLSAAVAAPLAIFLAVGSYALVQSPTTEPEMKVLESLMHLAAIKGTEYPPLEDLCDTTYRRLGTYISEGLESTDPYNQYTAAGDRALGKYWAGYPLICSCVAANHYPPRELVDNTEKLAIRLEVIDYNER